MQLYESIFILRPSLSDEESQRIIEKVKGFVERSGGSLLKADNWGKKKLAYEVKRERKGTFVCLQFRAPGAMIGELEHLYRIEDAVMKFLTVRVEKELPPQPATEVKEGEYDRVQ
jgi:small subunit ribosomal protein S6